MKAWLCGLDDDELSSVSSVLTFIGIDHSASFTSLDFPDFVVIGQSVESIESIELDDSISVISLAPTFDIMPQDNVWSCPLPWRSQTLWGVLKDIQQRRRMPQPSGVNLNLHIRHLESLLIRRALLSAQGVVSKAAQSLQIQRTTLIEKMRRYNIDKSEY